MELTRIEDPQVWYSPDIHDNREKPEAERFAVLLKPLTRQDMIAAKRAPVSKLQEECKDGAAMLERWDTVRDAVLRASVVEVRNLHVRRVKGGEETITDVVGVDGLIETNADAVLNDIYAAVEDHSILADGLLGKSASQSGYSATPDRASGVGAAGNAAEQKNRRLTRDPDNAPADAKPINPASTSTLHPSSPAALGQY